MTWIDALIIFLAGVNAGAIILGVFLIEAQERQRRRRALKREK